MTTTSGTGIPALTSAGTSGTPTAGTPTAGTPKYDKLKAFYQSMGEAVRLGLGPKPTTGADNAELFSNGYKKAAKEFLEGTGIDDLALGSLLSYAINPITEMIANYAVDPMGVLQSEQFPKLIQNLQRPVQDTEYAKIVAKELGYTVGPKESDRILVGKVLKKLGGDLEALVSSS